MSRWIKISRLGSRRLRLPTSKGLETPWYKTEQQDQGIQGTVLTSLLCGAAETWTCYRRHVKMLDAFHMRHLRYLMGIKWQDKITNNEVLQRAKMNGIEAMLMRAQLRWVGHVQRMSDNRMPKQILYSELSSDARSRGGQRKRYKDTLKHTLKMTGIDTETWHELAQSRTGWRQAVKKGVCTSPLRLGA